MYNVHDIIFSKDSMHRNLRICNTIFIFFNNNYYNNYNNCYTTFSVNFLLISLNYKERKNYSNLNLHQITNQISKKQRCT